MIFFEPTVVHTPDCSARFTAKDGDAVLGECALLIGGNYADVFALSFSDAAIGEGLLRAAYNYAANQGVYMGSCSAKNAEAATNRLRFEQKNGRLCNDIPTLLTGACGGFDK